MMSYLVKLLSNLKIMGEKKNITGLEATNLPYMNLVLFLTFFLLLLFFFSFTIELNY